MEAVRRPHRIAVDIAAAVIPGYKLRATGNPARLARGEHRYAT